MSAPLIYVIAGEPSGDLLGGRLMASLKRQSGGAVRFAGIGGEAMRAEGLDSLLPMADLSVMGLVEVLPRLPRILRHLSDTISDIERLRPDAIVTIDSWGFTGRVHARLKERGYAAPRIHYVAPMVWAWKAKRAKRLARVLDLLLCLLPNEPAWFEREGLRALHVGHPVVEAGADLGDGARFRRRHGLDDAAPLLCVLPGSRQSEVSRLLPVYDQALALIAQRHPELTLVVPTVETVAETVRAHAARWGMPVITLSGGQAERYDAFAACTAALAASGTVALELALAGLPAVITYRISPLTAFIATRFLGLKVPLVNLVNIQLNRMAIPELIQERCRPDLLAEEVCRLLEDGARREALRQDGFEAMRRLGWGQSSPADRAAGAIWTMMGEKRT